MAVNPAIETFRGRAGSKGIAGNNYVRVFDVETTTSTDNPFTAAGLPAINSSFPDDGTCVCAKIDKSQRGNGWRWHELIAHYEDQAVLADQLQSAGSGRGLLDNPSNPSDPTKNLPRLSGGGDVVVVGKRKDLDNKILKNTAGDPMSPPPGIATVLPFIVVTQNELANPFSKINYMQTVNSGAILGFGAREVLCASIEFEDDFFRANGTWTRYFKVSYRLSINTEKWNPTKFYSMGFHQLVGGKKQLIFLANKMPASSPQPLNAQGKWIADNGDPHEMEFRFYNEKNFSALNIRL